MKKLIKIIEIANTYGGSSWPWSIWKDDQGYGVSSKTDSFWEPSGWYDYDDAFETLEEAESFAKKTAENAMLDATLSKASGGAL